MQISLADAACVALDSIEQPELWQTLVIDRRKPITHRAWIMHGDTRICLHGFEPCQREEAFLHPHPWPSAMLVLDGSYDMHVGYAAAPESRQPDDVISLQLAAGSTYDMSVPGAWHKVVPRTRCYSLMINDPRWDTRLIRPRYERSSEQTSLNPAFSSAHHTRTGTVGGPGLVDNCGQNCTFKDSPKMEVRFQTEAAPGITHG